MSVITIVSIYLSLTYSFREINPLVLLNLSVFEYTLYQIIVFVMVMVGAILPDADIRDGNSKIFHSIFFPLAWIFRFIEIILSFVEGKPERHRGILHSPLGVILATLCLFGPIFLFALPFGIKYIGYIIVAYIFLVVGQMIHLIQDHLSDRIPLISGLIYLIIIGIVNIAILIAFPLIFAGLR
ncbi:MAG: metal-dependent hydrolase [archaeon]